MRRQITTHSQIDPFSEALGRIQRQLDNSPLEQVAAGLKDVIAQRRCAVEAGRGDNGQSLVLAAEIDRILDSLPTSFGERFHFDSQLINVIYKTVLPTVTDLPFPLVPRASGDWGLQTVRVFTPGKLLECSVHVFHFPGADDIAHVDLLDYAFLAHEFGHQLIRISPRSFQTDFGAELTQFINEARLRSITDRGQARQRAQEVLTSISRYWQPIDSQHDWAHELAIDVIALWLCGPAYAEAFKDYLERSKIDAHQISDGHPPYAVRVTGLTIASEVMGVSKYVSGIRALSDSWDLPAMKGDRVANYYGLTDKRIIKSVVSCAIRTCQKLGLTQCTDETLSRIREALLTGLKPAPNLDLIIAAWIQFEELGQEKYQEWERQAICALLR